MSQLHIKARRKLIKTKKLAPHYLIGIAQYSIVALLLYFTISIVTSDEVWGTGARVILMLAVVSVMLSISIHSITKKANKRSIEEDIRRQDALKKSHLYAPSRYFQGKVTWQNLNMISTTMLSKTSILAPIVYIVYVLFNELKEDDLFTFHEAAFASDVIYHTYISLVLISLATIGNAIFCPRPIKLYKNLSEFSYGEKPVFSLQRSLMKVEENSSLLSNDGLGGQKINASVRRIMSFLAATSNGKLTESELLEYSSWYYSNHCNLIARLAIFVLFASGYLFFFSMIIGRFIEVSFG